ncbi:MAG: hypothetical protein ACT6S0_15260 [Roseateles sp.]|uniref:hypothetical protein n=1 Tax=Roseateles sp. TaxID=1971397 RepID=UPI00403751FD
MTGSTAGAAVGAAAGGVIGNEVAKKRNRGARQPRKAKGRREPALSAERTCLRTYSVLPSSTGAPTNRSSVAPARCSGTARALG